MNFVNSNSLDLAGDFSFAHSLLHHHAFTSLVATSLDSRDVVLEKYPHARELLRGLEGWGVVDGGGGGGQDGEGEEEEENGEGDEEKEEEEKKDEEEDQDTEKTKPVKKEVRVRFGVDATKLTRAKVLGRKKPKKKKKEEPEPGFDKIVFNFPHVGGKTKDVNRQVRYNQGKFPSNLSFPSSLTPHPPPAQTSSSNSSPQPSPCWRPRARS